MEAGVEGFFRVEVTDCGAGIAIENQDKVFREFSQFDRNKLQGGGRKRNLKILSA
jgi:signal transduction histidine kinase